MVWGVRRRGQGPTSPAPGIRGGHPMLALVQLLRLGETMLKPVSSYLDDSNIFKWYMVTYITWFMMISWWFHDDFIGLSRLPSYEVDTARYDCYAIHVPHCACILWFCPEWLACSSGGLGCGRSIWFFEASNLAKITFALRDTVTVRRREVSRKWFLTKNMFALAQGNIQKVLFLVVGSSQAF